MLRLAFGLERAPAQRLDWPWYLVPDAGRDALPLRTDRLWDQPWSNFIPGPGAESVLWSWRSAILTHLEGFAPLAWQSGAVLRIADRDPFLPSRLAGTEWLPDYIAPGDDPAAHCRRWPASVTYRPGTGRDAYTLIKAAGAGAPGWRLTGYRQFSTLLADLAEGNLDAALIEAGDVSEALGGGFRWYAVSGTQQIILRARSSGETIKPEARAALSQAINREELAQSGTRDTLRPARAFLEPLLPRERIPETALFQFDPLVARQAWLALNLPARRLRLLSLAHPFLEPMAQRIAGQWQRTLELAVAAESVDSDRLWRAWHSDEYDLMLDVVDMDDGSLNDLWSDALEDAFTGKDANPPGWERILTRAMPYVPVLANTHWVVARPGQDALVAAVCPGCAPAKAP